jgi:hypothetical protein
MGAWTQSHVSPAKRTPAIAGLKEDICFGLERDRRVKTRKIQTQRMLKNRASHRHRRICIATHFTSIHPNTALRPSTASTATTPRTTPPTPTPKFRSRPKTNSHNHPPVANIPTIAPSQWQRSYRPQPTSAGTAGRGGASTGGLLFDIGARCAEGRQDGDGGRSGA